MKANISFCVIWGWSSTYRVNENIPVDSSVVWIRLPIRESYTREFSIAGGERLRFCLRTLFLFLKNTFLSKQGVIFYEAFSGSFECWAKLLWYRNLTDKWLLNIFWNATKTCLKNWAQDYICVMQKGNRCPFFPQHIYHPVPQSNFFP